MIEENKIKLQNILGEKYEVLKMIYRGGMGEVYLGMHRQLGSKVAIKIMTQKLSDDPEQKRRFQREAQLYANLRHPNIIPISDFGSEKSFDYMVFPFIDGENLKEKLVNQGPLDTDECLTIMIAVARALAYASENNVIHRDVKPSNIMIDGNGNVLMADFGISKDLKDVELTLPGTLLGSPKYMSPEQILGKEVDGRSDQYALGLIFYEMVSGRFPYTADDANALFYSHVNETPELPEEIVAKIRYEIPAIIKKLTEKDPDHRYDSFNSLIEDLKLIQFDQTEIRRDLPHSAIKKAPPKGFFKSRYVRLSAVLIILLLTGITTAFLYSPSGRESAKNQIPEVEQQIELTANGSAASPVSENTAAISDKEIGSKNTTIERQPTVADIKELLFNFGQPDKSGWYQVSLNKSTFNIGDEIIYTIEAKKDCYVVLMDFSTSDELVQLFPNRFHPDSLVKANTIYHIPGRGGFEVTGPAGSETVIGYACDSDFEIFNRSFDSSPFLSFTNDDKEALTKIYLNIQNLNKMTLIRKNIDFIISE